MALLGRDNSEDLNYSEESQPLTSPGAVEDDLNISHDDSDDVAQAPRLSHVVDIHEDQLRAQERQRKEVLNDDVEKMFELPKKFDISSLISGSPAVISEQQTPEHVSTTQGETRLYREEDYTSGLSVEISSMGHRRDSFPHIHHPLKALRSSRSSKSIRDDKPKKKKKKKKKRKMHTAKSFPSRSATLSPSIPEVEIEEYDISPPGSSSSSLSSDDFDDYRGEDDVDSPLLVPVQHQLEGSPKVQRTPQPSNDDLRVGFYIGDRATSPVHELDKKKKEETTGNAASPNKIFYVGDYADEQQLSPPAIHDRHQSDFGISYEEPKHSVKFSIGAEDSTANLKNVTSMESHGDGTSQPLPASSRSEPRIQKHRHKHHNHDPFKHEDLLLRRQIGSEVKIDDYFKHVPTETEEAILLQKADLDDMTSHRMENVRGIRRHKIAKHNAVASIVHIGKSDRGKKKPILKKKKIDHSPHEVFVELDELYLGENDYEWREKARWIKFEEDVEEGAERWGKPHVASLSFHSLLELRRGLESGCLLLDLDASDLPTIINSVIDTMIVHDQLRPENKGNVLRTLLLKHRHVGEGVKSLIRRNISYMNLKAMGLDSKNRHQGTKLSLMKSFSSASFGKSPSSTSIPMLERRDNKTDKVNGKGGKIEAKDLQFVKVDVDNNMQTDGVHIGITTPESTQKNIRDITRRIPKGAEAITVLVGSVDYLDTPTMAFVRLAEGQILENLTEVPLPVRFLFILLGPEKTSMDYHEVGRSISTLMSNQDFHDVAYRAESRGEILHAINQFLDESIVLPPGDWDQKTLLPIAEMNKKRARLRKRKKQKEEEKKALLKKVEEEKIPSDPLKRTGCIFGGLINDVRRRYPYYISDFTDALNGQCVAAFVFIFFACFAPCIAFGGLLEEKTGGYMGVTETVVSTSLSGIVFGLFAGQPLMIVGATGPVLVFEQSLYKFCKSNSIEFLTMRVWIGFWVMMISAIVVALESSFLVRYITRFTEEIFAILISLIFIFEVIKKLDKTFQYHPLVPLENYCKDFGCSGGNGSALYNSSLHLYTNDSNANLSSNLVYSHPNSSDHLDDDDDEGRHKYKLPQPNTALMSSILTIGTFLLAHFLKIFRNSKFLGRSARRALGDFGIVISIILMVLLDYSMPDIYTQKLSISNTFEPTSPNKRGWFVHPLGTKKPIQAYIIFASFIPAFLIFILLFLETQITEMILNKKEFKMRKGSGFHLDQVLMGVMTFVCALFGLPWMCAATVRTIAHTSALSVMSRTHAPGEKPKLVEVKEQRVTNILMNAMIGVSLTWGPLLQAIPLAVLFGVFLYLGVCSLGGVQMFKRMKLLLVPNKYHPSISYVRRVKTIRMHLFTVVQVVLLILLLIVKLSVAALAFPLFVILLIPLRLKLLGYVFTPSELQVLDKEEEDSDFEDEDDPDFYQQAHMPV